MVLFCQSTRHSSWQSSPPPHLALHLVEASSSRTLLKFLLQQSLGLSHHLCCFGSFWASWSFLISALLAQSAEPCALLSVPSSCSLLMTALAAGSSMPAGIATLPFDLFATSTVDGVSAMSGCMLSVAGGVVILLNSLSWILLWSTAAAGAWCASACAALLCCDFAVLYCNFIHVVLLLSSCAVLVAPHSLHLPVLLRESPTWRCQPPFAVFAPQSLLQLLAFIFEET